MEHDYTTIKTIEDYAMLVKKQEALLIYFSTEECNVCKVIKPKVAEMIASNYPKVKLFYVNINQAPELAAQNRIFAVPTLQIIFDGHEFTRKSRNFGLDELKNEIARPYQMMFS